MKHGGRITHNKHIRIMSNKRDFKKYVDAVGASIVENMMVAYYNVEGIDRKAVGEAVGKVLNAIEDAKNNANVFFDRGAKSFADHKEYSREKGKFFRALFEKIEKDLDAEIQEALKLYNGALPASVKEEQKKVAAE